MAFRSATSNCGLVRISQEDAAGVIVDGLTHLLDIGKVAQTYPYAESAQGSNEQGVGVAEEMLRGNDVLALCSQKDMKVLLIAAIPELKAVAWAASVRAATRRSRLVTVGFLHGSNREP